MLSRRDALRILLLGTGAMYLAPALSSCGHNEQLQRIDAPSRQQKGVRVGHQHFDLAHHYIRDHHAHELRWNAATVHRTDVAIIGSGPAGLAAAVVLASAGIDFLLLDSEPVAGGAARAGSYRSLRYPLASIYFVEKTAAVAELCAFANLEPHLVPHDALVIDGTVHSNIWSDTTLNVLPISARERSQLRRFRDELLERAHSSSTLPRYPLPEVLPASWAALDATSGEAFIAQYRSPLLRTILDLYARSSLGASLAEVNAYALLNFYAGELSGSRYTFPGGLGSLSAAMTTKLGDRIRTGMTCIRIENPHRAPVVWTLDEHGQLHRIDARVAIVTTQKFMLPWIIEEMPDAQRAAMHSLRYSPFLTVHLCSAEPTPFEAFDLWVPAGQKLYTDVINVASTGVRSDAAVLSVYAPRTPYDRPMMQSEDVLAAFARRIAQQVVHDLPQLNPAAVEEVHVFGWGHAVVVPVPGSHSGIAQAARQPVGKVILANTDNDSAPAFENAVEHGMQAAEQAIALFGARNKA